MKVILFFTETFHKGMIFLRNYFYFRSINNTNQNSSGDVLIDLPFFFFKKYSSNSFKYFNIIK